MDAARAGGEVRHEPSSDRLYSLKRAALSQTVVSQGSRRTNSPHEFYRYPARFAPRFARAAIEAFTDPGDLVLDPFVGGGTTAVEAMSLGRQCIASDLNTLATFVTRVKTHPLTEVDASIVRRWIRSIDSWPSDPPMDDAQWAEAGYFKDLDGDDTLALREYIGVARSAVAALRTPAAAEFARCILLRTAQWALDMRSEVPGVEAFREALTAHAMSMVDAALEFAEDLPDDIDRPMVLTQAVPGLADRAEVANAPAPRLVLTSPPYPGVYVIYHRWKLRGRKEIPAPYWVANELDGHGQSRYTMGARSQRSRDSYFEQLEAAFTDIAQIADRTTFFVQVVGFNEGVQQLDRYLSALDGAGLSEVKLHELSNSFDGRLWRSVPGRRWWTEATTMRSVAPHTAQEVVLVHRLR